MQLTLNNYYKYYIYITIISSISLPLNNYYYIINMMLSGKESIL